MIIRVEDLLELLDSIEYIRNINYYTNNCMAHDEIERTIREYADGAKFEISKLFWQN